MKGHPISSRPFGYARDFFLILLSCLLLVCSFPRFDLGFLAWIGLLPLLLALHGKNPKYSFLLSLAGGILFFLGIFHWILEVPIYKLLHHGLLALYLGSYFGFFGLVFSFFSIHWGVTHALFSAPFLWVSLEYLRSNLSFLALPWGLFAHSQYQYPAVIQIASLAGTYSISFLIVMVNAALASVVSSFLYRSRKGNSFHLHIPSKKGKWALGIIATSSLTFVLIYGYYITSLPIIGNGIKVSLIQGNIEQVKKWDPKYAKDIIQVYAEVTQKATRDQPTLIIWPETATPRAINLDPSLYAEIKEIIDKAGVPLILGSAQHQKFEETELEELRYSNSAYLIHPGLGVMKSQRYDKIRLFPFGEYLPYKEILPWSLINVRGSGNYAAGKEFTVFEFGRIRFGVTICWENVFPQLVRQFVRGGAQFMINITNEARFGRTAAPYQLASISVFRAVENRIFVIRCANTGVSCIIDPCGRIISRLKDQKGQDTFVQGWMSGWIIPLESRTLYTRYGDFVAWIAIVGSLVFLLGVFRHKRRQSSVFRV